MAAVVFWHKPCCGGNARQKDLLRAAGHLRAVRSLLAEPWTAARLRPYFGDATLAAWFKQNAPWSKSGEMAPKAVDAGAALALMVAALMVAAPLRVDRPLPAVEARLGSGFSAAEGLGLLAGAVRYRSRASRRDVPRPSARAQPCLRRRHLRPG